MESNNSQKDSPTPQAASPSFEKALRQLGFAVKAKELYPPGSAVVGQSVETAWEALAPHLDPTRQTRLCVLPKTFALGDEEPVQQPCLQVLQLAERLHARGIAAILVHPTADAESLVPLLTLATMNLDDLHAAGGVSAALRRDPIPGLTIEFLELARIFESTHSGNTVDAEDIWDRVLHNFSAQTEAPELDWDALAEDSSALRHLLGWILDDAARSQEFAEFSQVELVTLVCERVSAAALDQGAEQVAQVVDALKSLGGRLDPEAWIEVLSDPMPVEPYSVMRDAAERAGRVASEGDDLPAHDEEPASSDEGEIPVVDVTQEIASALSTEKIEELIDYTTRTREEASPRLYRLFDRLLHGREDRSEISQRVSENLTSESTPASVMERWPQIDDVLCGERVDPFVTKNYRTTLDHLTGARAPSNPWDMVKIGRRMLELDPRFVRSRDATIVLSIMNRETGDDDYETLARRLAGKITVLLDDGELDQVESIACQFAIDTSARSNRSVDQQRVAGSALGHIGHHSTIRAMLRLARGDDGDALKTFLRILGHLDTMAVPGLLEALAEEETRPYRLQLARILADMGPAAVPQIAKRMDDPRWYFVRNLVWIVGEIRDDGQTPLLRTCLRHSDHRVRRETITTLLKLDVTGAGDALATALRDEDPEVSLAALRALCQVDGPELPGLLAQYLRRPNWRGQNTAILTGAARAIGRAGCATALPELKALAGQPWFFRARRLPVRDAALWALGQIRRQQRRREHAEALQSADVVRAAA